MKIARVFPRKTNATPEDELCFYDVPPRLFPPEVDQVHVSITFSWDIERGKWLAKQWRGIGLVLVGGPAIGDRGEGFTPGMYLKSGYVITSRGCPNRCWFCDVWRRDGNVRELPITEGWNVQDDNLLACSELHIRSVFSMLKKQNIKAQFTGGFEAKRLKQWHVDLLRELKPRQIFFAYDMKDDLEPLIVAGKLLKEAGFNTASKILRCYVLIGYPGDTITDATKRLYRTVAAGFYPMAMLYRDHDYKRDKQWMLLQKQWARPATIYRLVKVKEK